MQNGEHDRLNDQMPAKLKHYNRQRSINVAATVFLLPVFFFMTVFIIYPIFDTFRISGFEWNGITADRLYIGLDNWVHLFSDGRFWHAFINNVIIMFCSIALQIPIAMVLATFIDFGGRKFNIFKVIWFLPLLMSSVAVGFLFQYALSTTNGIFTTISQMFGGGRVDLLGNPRLALFAVIGVIAWQYTPFYMVYFIAGYSNIDVQIYESAIIDGATKFRYFRHIALPLLLPIIKSGSILSLIGSLKYFDLVFVMTGGGPGSSTELMATYMYSMSFTSFKMGYGSTIAAAMFILVTIIALIVQQSLKERQ